MRSVTVVTRKGQTTIPRAIREALAIEEGDRVTWTVDEAGVHLQKEESVADRTFGAFRGMGPSHSAEALRELAEEAIAASVVERSPGR